MNLEIKETEIIAFCNLLLGIAVMLGSLAYYMNFTSINLGGVFPLFFGSLAILLLLGLGILFKWNHNCLGKLGEDSFLVISRPFLRLSMLFWGTVVLAKGGEMVLCGFVVMVSSLFLIQISSSLSERSIARPPAATKK